LWETLCQWQYCHCGSQENDLEANSNLMTGECRLQFSDGEHVYTVVMNM
jgi:hypothetical protein